MTESERRRLGSHSLGAIVAANRIGAGVFTTSSFALADLGSPIRVMAAWVAVGFVAMHGVLCYGALAARQWNAASASDPAHGERHPRLDMGCTTSTRQWPAKVTQYWTHCRVRRCPRSERDMDTVFEFIRVGGA